MKYYLKKIELWLLLLLITVSATAQGPFNGVITIPANLPVDAIESVKDMAYWLEKGIGNRFDIRQANGRQSSGITLSWVTDVKLTAAVQKELLKDGQTCYIQANGFDAALIAGQSANALINGIYTLLDELGYRWFMPGDNWVTVPAFNKPVRIDKIYRPDFRNRTYVGTGSISAIPGLDPSNSFYQDFIIWNRRNRYSMDYPSKGHLGQAFFNEKKKELEKRPDLFCGNKVNVYGRIDIQNQEAVRLYIDWAKNQVNPGMQFPVIGVDPADGSGGKDDCMPTGMPQIKTWSDKYFWLANKVAEQIPAADTSTVVQLYAYSDHAELPGFKLNPRVYPIIIPYAFQRITTPQGFIKMWNKFLNGAPMGIYDYWNITQWSVGLPQFNIYTIPEKLPYWKKNNITTIHLESTYGKGIMGHTYWLASRMMWDCDQSFENLYTRFLKECFGNAADDIRRMYDRWSLNYQNEMEVNLSIHDLTQAQSKVKDPVILRRIDELKAYVHYIRLYYDYLKVRTPVAYKELIWYLYQIHSLRLVQTRALEDLYIPKPTGITPKFEPAQRKSAILAWPEMKKMIDVNFFNDQKKHAQVYQVSQMRFDVRKVTPVATSGKVANPLYITGRNEYKFYLNRARTVKLQAGSTQDTKLYVLDEENNILEERNIKASKSGYTEVGFSLPAGVFSIIFGDYGRFSRVKFPADVVFISSGVSYYDNAGYPLLYVYVPPDVQEIIYEDVPGPGTNKRGDWVSPQGKTIKPVRFGGNVYRIPVDAASRGKIWTLNIGHRQYKLLNIPHVVSLTPFTYK